MNQDDTQLLSLFRQEQERLPAFRSCLLLVDFLMARLGKALSIPGISNPLVVKAQLRQPFRIKHRSFFNRLPDRAGDPRNGFHLVGIDDHQVLDTDLVELVFLKELGEKAVLSIDPLDEIHGGGGFQKPLKARASSLQDSTVSLRILEASMEMHGRFLLCVFHRQIEDLVEEGVIHLRLPSVD